MDEADALRELREGYLAEEEYKLVRKEDGAVIGSIGLRFGEDACSGLPAEPEVGFWLDEPFQGQGYAGEALEALLGRAKGARAVRRSGDAITRETPGQPACWSGSAFPWCASTPAATPAWAIRCRRRSCGWLSDAGRHPRL